MTINPDTPDERDVPALVDAEFVRAGDVIRICTTGGGGWGDPLDRDPAMVVRDVTWEKVTTDAALSDYGVVLTGAVATDDLSFDDAATRAERERRRAQRGAEPFFDRGPGYERLSGGPSSAEVDWL